MVIQGEWLFIERVGFKRSSTAHRLKLSYHKNYILPEI